MGSESTAVKTPLASAGFAETRRGFGRKKMKKNGSSTKTLHIAGGQLDAIGKGKGLVSNRHYNFSNVLGVDMAIPLTGGRCRLLSPTNIRDVAYTWCS